VLYVLQVSLLLIVGPIVATTVDVLVTGHTIIAAGTFWFVFFGGVRLLIAGVSQSLNPKFTLQNVLGQKGENPDAAYMTQELGFANIGFGVLGVVGPWLGWAPAGALALGVFFLLAGLRHIAKRGKGTSEWFATITDVAYGLVLLVIFVLALIPASG
jgi:hypothetical protein